MINFLFLKTSSVYYTKAENFYICPNPHNARECNILNFVYFLIFALLQPKNFYFCHPPLYLTKDNLYTTVTYVIFIIVG